MPPPPPRKSNTLLIVLVIVGVVLVLGISGVVCLAVVGLSVGDAEPSGPSAAEPAEETPAADLGPCAHLKIDSAEDAFDKAKMDKCGACCKEKAPGSTMYYYHFENNVPPGRCRCTGGAKPKAGGDCSSAANFIECMSCCTEAGKKSAKYEKGKGCSCE